MRGDWTATMAQTNWGTDERFSSEINDIFMYLRMERDASLTNSVLAYRCERCNYDEVLKIFENIQFSKGK